MTPKRKVPAIYPPPQANVQRNVFAVRRMQFRCAAADKAPCFHPSNHSCLECALKMAIPRVKNTVLSGWWGTRPSDTLALVQQTGGSQCRIERQFKTS